MPLVEVFEGEQDDPPIFAAEFGFLPRVGERISKDAGGYFRYYCVEEVWHRQDMESRQMTACVRVRLED